MTTDTKHQPELPSFMPQACRGRDTCNGCLFRPQCAEYIKAIVQWYLEKRKAENV